MKPRQIVFYCKNCKCSTKISYDISGDPDKPVLDGVRIKCHRCKCVISLKDTTEGKVVARADEAGRLALKQLSCRGMISGDIADQV